MSRGEGKKILGAFTDTQLGFNFRNKSGTRPFERRRGCSPVSHPPGTTLLTSPGPVRVSGVTLSSPVLKRWKRLEYERFVDLGLLRGDPVELIGGQLVVAEPQGSYHATAVGAADDALRAILPAGWIVRAQMPVALDDESAPEPDLVVVPGIRAAYRESHPAHPALAVEVADSSLEFDRQHKGSLYARAGVQDYWIVNLIDRVLEVYRDPGPDPSAPYGWRYRSVQALAPSAGSSGWRRSRRPAWAAAGTWSTSSTRSCSATSRSTASAWRGATGRSRGSARRSTSAGPSRRPTPAPSCPGRRPGRSGPAAA